MMMSNGDIGGYDCDNGDDDDDNDDEAAMKQVKDDATQLTLVNPTDPALSREQPAKRVLASGLMMVMMMLVADMKIKMMMTTMMMLVRVFASGLIMMVKRGRKMLISKNA